MKLFNDRRRLEAEMERLRSERDNLAALNEANKIDAREQAAEVERQLAVIIDLSMANERLRRRADSYQHEASVQFKTNAACENQDHAGDRLVDRRDLLERRIEWRRLTDQGREHVRIIRRECKECMRRELFEDVLETESLLG